MTPQKNYLNLNLIQNYLGIPFNGVFVWDILLAYIYIFKILTRGQKNFLTVLCVLQSLLKSWYLGYKFLYIALVIYINCCQF